MDSEPKTPDEIEVDRLLGNLALIKLSALQPMGGPSEPTLYRAECEGLIKFVRNGRINSLTRATAKRILLHGLGPVSFLYGKKGEAKRAAELKQTNRKSA
jgi:hypothetical protein